MDGRILTIDGQIWTGRRGETLPKGRLLVEAGTITALGRVGDFPVEPRGIHLDFSNRWIIPGLIDTHSHLMFGESRRRYEDYIRQDHDDIMLLRAVRNAQIHQAVGVTTLRDSGSRNRVALSLREGIERGYVSGPRVLASGRPITMTGGHFWWCNGEADGVDGVRTAVRQLCKDGVDFIKIMASGGGTAGTDPRQASYTLEELQEIVREAHSHGLKCSAHCEATASVERAVTAGVDTIEHAGFQEPDGTRTYRADLVKMMVDRGLSYSPTIQTAYRGLDRFRDSPEISPRDHPRIAAAHYKLTRKLENLGRMLDAGVTVVAGTDAIGQFGDYVIGLELFVHAGMSPEEALMSATSVAAEVIGLRDVTGTLKPGTSADLLVLGDDPLADVSALRHLVAVLQEGERVSVPPHIEASMPETAASGHRSDIEGALAVGRSV